MTVHANTTRRRVLVMAGAAGVAALTSSTAEASKFQRLDAALVELRATRKYLQNAPNIFGGHKAEALRLIHATIQELEAAIAFAK